MGDFDVKCVGYFYHICSAWGLVPFYNFKNQKPLFTRLSVIINLGVMVYSVAGFYIVFTNNLTKRNYSKQSLYITEVAHYAIYFSMPLVSSLSCFFNKNNWVRLMKNLEKTSKNIKPTTRRNHNVYLSVLFILHLDAFVNLLAHLYLDADVSTWLNILIYIWYIPILCVICLFLMINSMLSHWYMDLNENVLTTGSDAENNFMSKEHEAYVLCTIKENFGFYADLSGLIKELSKLYGCMFATIFTSTLVTTINILNWFVNKTETLSPDLVELFCVIIFSNVIILSCDNAADKGKNFVNTSYSIEEHFELTSSVRLELLDVAEQGDYYFAKYTLFGAVDIDRGLILTLISILTTCMIVILQFNLS